MPGYAHLHGDLKVMRGIRIADGAAVDRRRDGSGVYRPRRLIDRRPHSCEEIIVSAQLNVGDYVIQRLAKEGITDCFGVAGDYVFRMCDAVVRSKSVKWIGCSNELDAAYAADGYARVRGCSM